MNINRVTAIASVCAVAAVSSGVAVAASGGSDSGSSSTKTAKCVGPGKGHHRGGPLKDIASALGISTSSLQTQLKDGKKLSEIATAQGKTLDDVKTAVTASLKTKLDKAVSAGKITQTQADDQLKMVDTMIDNIEAGKVPPRPPMGMHGGPGGPPGLGGPPPSGY
jgi:hypothetical protein